MKTQFIEITDYLGVIYYISTNYIITLKSSKNHDECYLYFEGSGYLTIAKSYEDLKNELFNATR